MLSKLEKSFLYTVEKNLVNASFVAPFTAPGWDVHDLSKTEFTAFSCHLPLRFTTLTLHTRSVFEQIHLSSSKFINRIVINILNI